MFAKPKTPYRLLTPGPVPLHPEVQRILAEPMLHHRTPEFETILKSVLAKLKKTFHTNETVFIHTSTGSGAMESAIVNTLCRGDHVLCVVSGKFGERWAEMAKVFGLNVTVLKVNWGEAVRPLDVHDQLTKNPQIKAVFTQACETSTATLHPIKELATLIKNTPAILIVDAITAVGAVPLEMDNWGIDVVIGGSQKAFMLPTGLSFIALSQKAWAMAELSNLPKFYFDLKKERTTLNKGETHFSTAVPLVRALDLALDHLVDDRQKITLQRIQKLAAATRAAAPHLGLQVYSQAPSDSVTALVVPTGIDSQKLRDHLEKEFNITIMGGQDQLKGKIIRIGHLGYIENEDMHELFKALHTSLNEFSKLTGTANLSQEALAQTLAVLKQHLK